MIYPPNQFKNVRDYCIKAFACFPSALTIKRLHHIIEEDFGVHVSYQAVFKTVKQLSNEQTITKYNSMYILNTQWINNLESFIRMIKHKKNKSEFRLLLNEGVKDIKSIGDTTSLTFCTLAFSDRYIISLLKRFISNFRKNEDKNIYIISEHNYYSMAYPKLNYELGRPGHKKNSKLYLVFSGDTNMDKELIKFYNKKAYKQAVIDTTLANYDLIIFGNTIIERIIPKKTRDKLHDLFKKSNNLADFDYLSFYKDVLDKEEDVIINVTNNENQSSFKKNLIKTLFK